MSELKNYRFYVIWKGYTDIEAASEEEACQEFADMTAGELAHDFEYSHEEAEGIPNGGLITVEKVVERK